MKCTYPRSRKDSSCLVFKCLGSPLVFIATASNSSKDGGTNKSRQLIERIDVMARLARVQLESVPKQNIR